MNHNTYQVMFNLKRFMLNNELHNPISVIPEYTKIFAEANRITLDNYNVLYKSPIETLRYCLVFQKQIFIETT